MSKESGAHGIVGTILDTPEPGKLRCRSQTLVVVDRDGLIEAVVDAADPGYEVLRRNLDDQGRLVQLPATGYLLPGMIDMHVHAPQWPQLGKALDVPLETWLNRYTFPLEARYADVGFAAGVYRSLVSALLANGTTTAVYFGTVHRKATQVLADECLAQGQRAIVGKVAMDHPDGCPDFYRDASAGAAVEETQLFVDYVRGHASNGRARVLPAATPRFVPSCTDELLAGLGDLVGREGCLVQTHCSESDWAHQYGLERYGRTDTATYAEFGLLRRGTVLAHSNFVDDDDLELINAAGAAIAHCPRSNVFFANAVLPVRRVLDAGVHVGIGTDISGGPNASLLATAADAVAVSRVLEDGVDTTLAAAQRGVAGSRIDFLDAFWMATTGAGRALALPIGLIEPGYRFDAIAITPGEETNLTIWPDFDSPEDVVQKILHNAGRANIAKVWVDGRAVIA